MPRSRKSPRQRAIKSHKISGSRSTQQPVSTTWQRKWKKWRKPLWTVIAVILFLITIISGSLVGVSRGLRHLEKKHYRSGAKPTVNSGINPPLNQPIKETIKTPTNITAPVSRDSSAHD